MTQAAVAEAFADLTEKQRSRLLAHLSGEPTNAIARREGVRPQSVAETLAAPPVRELYLRVAGHRLRAEAGSIEKLVSDLLGVLQEAALKAKRPVVFANGYAMEPDHRVRIEAATRLLAMIEPAAGTERVDEVVARETHVREYRQRTKSRP